MIYIIIGIIILLILMIIYFYYEDHKLKVTKYNIESNKIKNDYKIIQISDFHNTKNKWLHKQLVNTIKEEKPNIIVFTGDLIDKFDNKYSSLLLDELNGICKMYYVPGNHEYRFDGYSKLLEVLYNHKVEVLDNKCISLNNSIDLYGIKDPMFGMPKEENQAVKDFLNEFSLNNKKYSILLSHRPEHFKEYCNKKFDLVFTGHAHGGQWILPIIGPIFSPHQGMFPKYARGIHKRNNTSMIVCRGLGNSLNACIRINNRPELVIVSLSK